LTRNSAVEPLKGSGELIVAGREQLVGYHPPQAPQLTGSKAPMILNAAYLLDRVLAGGVVVSGELTLSIADVDMVRVSLRALVTSVSALAQASDDEAVPGR